MHFQRWWAMLDPRLTGDRLVLPTKRTDTWSDVAVIALLTCLLALSTAIPSEIARPIVALPLAICAPGFAVLRVIKGPRSADLFGLGLVILVGCATYPLLGLLLYVAGIAIELESTLLAVLGVCAVSAAIEALRLVRDGPSPVVDGVYPWFSWLRFGYPTGSRIYIAAAAWLAVTGVLVAGAMVLLPTRDETDYSAIYLNPPAGDEAFLSPDAAGQVRVPMTVANETEEGRRYTISPVIDGRRDWGTWGVEVQSRRDSEVTVGGQLSGNQCLHHIVVQLRDTESQDVVNQLSVWARSSKEKTGYDDCVWSLPE